MNEMKCGHRRATMQEMSQRENAVTSPASLDDEGVCAVCGVSTIGMQEMTQRANAVPSPASEVVVPDVVGKSWKPKNEIPAFAASVFIFGVMHTGTTIAIKMFGAMGWHLDEFGSHDVLRMTGRSREAIKEGYEHPQFQKLNQAVRDKRPVGGMKELLAGLPRPWALKDPTLIHGGLNVWGKYAPEGTIAVWCRRDPELVEKSFADRGWGDMTPERLKYDFDAAERTANEWKGPLMVLDHGRIADAIGMFDVGRS